MPLRSIFISVLLAIALLFGAGCASREKARDGHDGTTGRNGSLDARSEYGVSGEAEASPIPELPRPVPGFGPGLLVHRLILSGAGEEIGPILDRFRKPLPPRLEERLELLQANGLRVVGVPLAQLNELVGLLPADPVRESTWMGTVTEWTSVAESARVAGQRLARVDGEPLSFEEGRFRLLVRAYPFPTEIGLRLRIEWLGQFHQPERNPLLPDRRTENLMGSLIASLAGQVDLEGDLALVLLSEDPGVEWNPSVPATPDVESEETDLGQGELTEDGGRDWPDSTAPQAGPDVQLVRTAGEEIFESEDGLHRLILIFVPSLGRTESMDSSDREREGR